MNISRHNAVSPDEILSDVLQYVGDEEFKDNSRGYYVSQIQQALQELAFDTFFDKRTDTFKVPENLVLDMPEGMFNIRQIYLYNGVECNISNSVNVYWKRNYYTKGNGFLARDKGVNPDDPFYQSRGFTRHSGHDHLGAHSHNNSYDNSLRRQSNATSISNSYYYNIQAGKIMFSSSVRSFQNIAIEYNGVGANIGEVPFIPMLFREAIKAWVIDAALRVKMARSVGADFNKWQTLYSINNAELKRPFTGLWAEAEVRAKMIDSKQREDLKEYLSRLDY